jgi:hypothetical protein
VLLLWGGWHQQYGGLAERPSSSLDPVPTDRTANDGNWWARAGTVSIHPTLATSIPNVPLLLFTLDQVDTVMMSSYRLRHPKACPIAPDPAQRGSAMSPSAPFPSLDQSRIPHVLGIPVLPPRTCPVGLSLEAPVLLPSDASTECV